jgi:hypothetical protein
MKRFLSEYYVYCKDMPSHKKQDNYHEDYSLLECEAAWFGRMLSFWKNLLLPSSG